MHLVVSDLLMSYRSIFFLRFETCKGIWHHVEAGCGKFFVVVVFFKINLVKTGINHPAGVWMYLSECCVLTLLCIYVDLLIFIHISSLNIKLTASIWFCGCNQQSQPKTTLACDFVAFLHFALFCSPPAPEGNLSPWLLNPPEPFSR